MWIAVTAPLALLLLQSIWGVFHDVRTYRSQSLRNEMNKLRAQAVRRAGRLESLVETHAAMPGTWSVLREESWLKNFWTHLDLAPQHEPYAAVVDETATIVLHNDAKRIGKRLAGGWYEQRVPEAGDDVFRLEGGPLTDKVPAYDLTVPLFAGSQWIGDYHEGLDARWFKSQVAAGERSV